MQFKECIPNVIEQRNAGYAEDIPDPLLKKTKYVEI